MLDIFRWPLLVFFATSGVVGVVYGFISPEWPLTQLSVGLTGDTRADMVTCYNVVTRPHDGLWSLLHLSPIWLRDIPHCDQGPGK